MSRQPIEFRDLDKFIRNVEDYISKISVDKSPSISIETPKFANSTFFFSFIRLEQNVSPHIDSVGEI